MDIIGNTWDNCLLFRDFVSIKIENYLDHKCVDYICSLGEKAYKVAIPTLIGSNFLILSKIVFNRWNSRKVNSDNAHGNIAPYDYMQLVFFVIFISLYSFMDVKLKNIYNEDEIYFSYTMDNVYRSNEKFSSAPLIVEFLIENDSDFKQFTSFIIEKRISNIFISTSSLSSLERANKIDNFFNFIRNQKSNGSQINIFTDIEFQYGDISCLNQMALASTRSLETIYNMSYEHALRLRDRYCVDYILGPVLDRKFSTSDQTISSRSFGQDIKLIKQASIALILGYQDAGINCIPKHFPGHPQNLYRNDDPHFRVYMTKYSDQGLKVNASPFDFVYRFPSIKVNSFLTDHIIIPSITSAYPYTIYFSDDDNASGLSLAKNKFSNAQDEIYFISDDLVMLLSGALAQKDAITDKTNINLTRLSSEVKKHLTDLESIYEMYDLSYDNVSDTLSVLARSSLLAGHSLVLIRSQKPTSVEKILDKLMKMIHDPQYSHRFTRAIERNKRFCNQELSSKSYNFYSILSTQNLLSPFIKLSTSTKLDNVKIRTILESKVFYVSSCYLRDDIVELFSQDYIYNSLKFSDINIFTSNFGKSKQDIIVKNLNLYLNNNRNYDYYIFVLCYDWQSELLKELIKHLKNESKMDKLILFIAHTPDYLFSIYNKESTIPYEILHSSHVISIFSNSIAVLSEFKHMIRYLDITFGEIGNLPNVTVDIPNYFHNSYDINLFAPSVVFEKMFYSKTTSSFVKNNQLIICIILLQLIFLFLYTIIRNWSKLSQLRCTCKKNIHSDAV